MKSRMTVRLIFVATFLAAAAGAAASSQPEHADWLRERAMIVPLADHHQHLLGPTALPAVQAQPATVAIPDALKAVLENRARLYGTVSSADELADYYEKDAHILTWDQPSHWAEGREAVLKMLSGVVKQHYEFRPVTYAIDGNVAVIGGYVAAGERKAPALDFLLALRRDADDRWRIVTESTTIKSPPRYPAPITAQKVVGDLDDAGIPRAIVLSVAYWLNARRFPDPRDELTLEYDAVRAENDWVASEVARFPSRLVMACSANVLRRYAAAELERCSRIPQSRAFKLHLADAEVDLRKPEHLAAVQKVFAAANRLKVPLIVHFGPRFQYGPEYVELFLSKVMTLAPDITVQIAHLGGDGPGIDNRGGSEAFAAVMARRDPRAKNLYFDIAGLVTQQTSEAEGELMAGLIRRIGLSHVLYGSDGQPPNRPVLENWVAVRRRLPLTNTELRVLASNIAPYLRAQISAGARR